MTTPITDLTPMGIAGAPYGPTAPTQSVALPVISVTPIVTPPTPTVGAILLPTINVTAIVIPPVASLSALNVVLPTINVTAIVTPPTVSPPFGGAGAWWWRMVSQRAKADMLPILANESTAARRQVEFDLRDATDFGTPEAGEAGGQPQISTNGAAFTNTGIGVLVAITASTGRYYGQLTQAAVATAGDIIRTRYKSANTVETPGESAQVVGFNPAATVWDDARADHLVADTFGEHVVADITYIHGTALTETSGGNLAGNFSTLYDNADNGSAVLTLDYIYSKLLLVTSSRLVVAAQITDGDIIELVVGGARLFAQGTHIEFEIDGTTTDLSGLTCKLGFTRTANTVGADTLEVTGTVRNGGLSTQTVTFDLTTANTTGLALNDTSLSNRRDAYYAYKWSMQYKSGSDCDVLAQGKASVTAKDTTC